MVKNSDIAIDDLIKRIYKSYVEIKVGEFRQIDRDLLLNDIGLLYTSIKELYPSNEISAIEFDLGKKELNSTISSKESKIIEKSQLEKQELAIEDVIVEDLKIEQHADLNLNEKVVDVQNNTQEISYNAPKQEIDLSLFDDSELNDSLENQNVNLIDKKSDNTSSPILKGFQLESKEVKEKFQVYQEVPSILEQPDEVKSSAIEKSQIEELVTESDDSIDEVHNSKLNQEKKSASSIVDFLHHDEKKTSNDIYNFLDLNTRIGLIELFFKGNSMELTECLIWLNKLDTKEASIQIIDKFAEKFGIAKNEDIYKQFVSLVDRRLESQR